MINCRPGLRGEHLYSRKKTRCSCKPIKNKSVTMKHPSCQWAFLAAVATGCKARLDPPPLSIADWDGSLSDWSAEDESQIWNAHDPFSSYPSYPPNVPFAASYLVPPEQKLTFEPTAPSTTGMLHDTTSIGNKDPSIHPHLLLERPSSSSTAVYRSVMVNNPSNLSRDDKSAHGAQQFPTRLSVPDAHNVMGNVNAFSIHSRDSNRIESQKSSTDAVGSTPDMTRKRDDGLFINSHYSYEAQGYSTSRGARDRHTIRGGPVAFPQHQRKALEPPDSSFAASNRNTISILGLPREAVKKHLVEDLHPKLPAKRAASSVSESPSGSKRKPIGQVAVHSGLSHATSSQRYPQEKVSWPFQDPAHFMMEIRAKRKKGNEQIDPEKIKQLNIVFNTQTFDDQNRKRLSPFPVVADRMVDNPEKILLIRTGEALLFIERFISEWKGMGKKPCPAVLAKRGMDVFYKNSEAWTKCYRNFLKIDEDQLWDSLKKICQTPSGIRQSCNEITRRKLTDSLVITLFLVDMIATIFPRPVDVDVNLNKYQLFQSAFRSFEARTRETFRSIPQAEDHIKKSTFVWECVNHWLNSREDYAHSGLIDSATGVMAVHYKAFFNLVLAHSVENLSLRNAKLLGFKPRLIRCQRSHKRISDKNPPEP
ncbi:hypothetical protein PSTT_06435 [Puccinia striiformis]|uniref:Uncharacterized protein n=1 Tax=Puccinia striiformis TaxID=27350 RepID=A0A2S4VKG0_9BASI|nr:hypothetical protein PSTT_06435 [Puccinia striiformis]